MNGQDDGRADSDTVDAAAPRLRLVTPAADADEEPGGEPACYAHLVCEECGSVTTEGHRDGCPSA